VQQFAGKLAVVTGAGHGMGRELCRQLAAEGCHVATCDVSEDAMAETKALCEAESPAGTVVTTFVADVSDEAQVLAFRDHVLEAHGAGHVDLVFNNAGIGGGGSMLVDDRGEWDKTFGVCWGGVYHGTRAFLPLLVKAPRGHIVNTSSVNGFWACLGPDMAHTAYSAAKFAVKGFTEALITDLRLNAPHVKAVLVMPGHIGTSIVLNSPKVLGKPEGATDADLARMRDMLARRGMPAEALSDEQLREAMHQMAILFRDNAPVSAAQAATVILDGVRSDAWRVLVGEDAKMIDRMVRQTPELAYEQSFARALNDEGHMRLLE